MYDNINLAIIGCGKWGFNHVRTAHGILGDRLHVCDSLISNKKKIEELSPSIRFTENLDDILNDDNINSVIIATPAETHYEIAKKCLKKGKNVLVEKPITLLSEDAADLVEIAKEQNKTLMVGHILLYHPAIIAIKESIDAGELGRLQYIYSNRLNLGTIRSEENILWSFAPHDISIIQYFTGTNPIEIYAKGASFVQNSIEDTTLTFMRYPENVSAHIFVSWLHPFKEHRLVVIGDKGMFVFEDSLKENKLKFYNKGYQNVDGVLEKFDNDYETIEFENKPPLEEEQKHFFEAITKGVKPLSDGNHALEVLKILEEAQKSL